MDAINSYCIGQKAEERVYVTDELILEIAKVSNDYNPIHISDDYATKTIFGKRIAHGLICEALISNLIGTKLPGPGAVFINIFINFYKPVFIGDTITARGEIVEKEKSVMMIDVGCYNQENELVVSSISKVKLLNIEQ